MYWMQDALSPYVWPYYFFVTLVVSFFAVNLCLAVIAQNYDETQTSESGIDGDVDEAFFRQVYKNDGGEKSAALLKDPADSLQSISPGSYMAVSQKLIEKVNEGKGYCLEIK